MRELEYPTTAYLEISPICNLKCSFCFSKFKNKNFIGIKETEQICKKLKSMGFDEIILFGGEPTINPKIEEITKILKKEDFKIKMVTNAYRLNETTKKALNMMDSVSVSIHGIGKTHDKICGVPDAFSKVSTNIKEIKKEVFNTGVLFSPTPNNIKEIYKTADFFSDTIVYFGVNRLIRTNERDELKIIDTLKIIEDIKKINKKLKLKSTLSHSFPYCKLKNIKDKEYISNCKAGINFISIDNRGNIKICSASQIVVGNILNKKGEEYNQRFYDYRKLKWIPKKCAKCSHLGECFTGCKFSVSANIYRGDVLLE